VICASNGIVALSGAVAAGDAAGCTAEAAGCCALTNDVAETYRKARPRIFFMRRFSSADYPPETRTAPNPL
jgi:hypothetical protein